MNHRSARICLSGVTILVDPWLVGDLTFYGQTWAFKGKKGKLPPLNTDEIAAKADLIVITQVHIHVAQSFCPEIKIVEQQSLHDLAMLLNCRCLLLSVHSH